LEQENKGKAKGQKAAERAKRKGKK
jgi:hypothetical protein